MAKIPAVGTIVILIFAVAMIGAIATQFNQVTAYDQANETNTTPHYINTTYAPITIINITNGTCTLPAANYTVNATGLYINLTDTSRNCSNGDLTAIYTYRPDVYIGGIGKIALAIVMLVVVIGIALYGYTALSKR